MSNEELFGVIVKDLRKKRNISQERLADICQLDRTYISLIERGLRQPTIKTLFKISHALQIKPSELILHLEGVWNEDFKD